MESEGNNGEKQWLQINQYKPNEANSTHGTSLKRGGGVLVSMFLTILQPLMRSTTATPLSTPVVNAFSPRLDRRVYAKLRASEEIAACILSHAADESPLSEQRKSEREGEGGEGEGGRDRRRGGGRQGGETGKKGSRERGGGRLRVNKA